MHNKTIAGVLTGAVLVCAFFALLSTVADREIRVGELKTTRDNERYEKVLNNCLDKIKDAFQCRSAAEDAAHTLLYWDGKSWTKSK